MNGLYIHIPFCVRKCKYCDFASYSGMEGLFDEYIASLEREAKKYRGAAVETIFIGGGTPSILSAEQLEKTARICFDNFNIADDYEFTVEINPGTLTPDKITAMLLGGINRASVGVQSLSDAELKAIGRIHDGETAVKTIETLAAAGFKNISADIMTALPYQTSESLLETLKILTTLPITHISAYSLILEEGTPLEREYSRGLLMLPDEETDREMYADTVNFLEKHGFERYEISNFAKNGFECRHNIKYWTAQPYIGLGAAAHSYDGNTRRYNTSDVRAYMDGEKSAVTPLSRDDKISEFIITGLRMTRGISASEFYSRFGEKFEEKYKNELEKFLSLSLMDFNGENYFLTPRGIDVSNSVLCEFV